MSTTTLPSRGTAKRIASRKRSAVASSVPHASARTAATSGVAVALAHAVGERGGDLAGLALDAHVDAVVRRLLEPDRDQRLRLRLHEVLGLDAVQVRADRQHDVGLVPQPPGGLDVGRQPDQARMPRRQHARRAIGRQDRSAEPLREPSHGAPPHRARRRQPTTAAAEARVELRHRGRYRLTRCPPFAGARSVRGSLGARAGRSRPPDRPAASAQRAQTPPPRRPPRRRAERPAPRGWTSTTGANIAAWPSVSCSTPRYSPGAAQRRRDVGRDHEDRRPRRPRLADRPERVRRARPGGRQRDAEPPRRARVSVGGVGGGLLVADADEPDRRLPQRLPQRQVVHPGQAEADLHACRLQLRRR